jgi:mRNA-degrading endonuclease RelE of RelBE toxin-antitoxin system
MPARVSRSKPAVPPVRYAAFLRGVMPTNAKMPDLVRAFASAGFEDVATVLASGNVVFSAARAPEAELARMAEEAMRKRLGRSFATIVRPIEELDALLATDPYAPFGVAPGAKRIVTFLRERVAEAPDPRSFGAALKGDKLGQFWKYRVGDYRVIAEIRDREIRIVVIRLGHRSEVYR